MALELLYVKGWGNAEVAAKLKGTEQDIANLKFQAKKRLTTTSPRPTCPRPCSPSWLKRKSEGVKG